eukprot:CAMPEP_0206445194 /NCGR_PEP_ID=MMETSP0324_2-20121206/15358_1 /ASSEMBLY_ACC=CAM_ASM_000836 /TAXON_ID=2866 /ORGANISM="Crypthecodinium cohnii, Strain Seligo" /LENGTH=375 /DNA_ID=CAMNT_0053913353 /DNA_START=93 /DNA_END=1220 /DNA_ORIENTATION=+
MSSFFSALSQQCSVLNHILGMLGKIAYDANMKSRISYKSFIGHFVGMLLHEGFTDPRVTAEQVAGRILGSSSNRALEGKVALITGATGGLGLESARVLMQHGCHVVFAVRTPSKAEELIKEMKESEKGQLLTGKATVLELNLDDLTTIKPFVEKFLALNLPLNYLMNNAGVMTPKLFRPSKQGFETQFATNHLAHFLLTNLLMPKLQETKRSTGEARIIILSSVGSTLCKSLDLTKWIPPLEQHYNGAAEYGISKALNLFHCRELQRRCAESGILCCAVHPGVIKTGLTREGNSDSTVLYDSILFKWMHKTVPQGAATQVYCCISPDIEKQINDGAFFWYNCKPQRALGIAAKGERDDLVPKIWEISQKLVDKYD